MELSDHVRETEKYEEVVKKARRPMIHIRHIPKSRETEGIMLPNKEHRVRPLRWDSANNIIF